MTDEAASGLGLCLTGGGITGAMYQVGCLAALEDHFEGFRACDFKAYVGSSSGATVAMALAGGITAQRMYRALLDPADDFFPLQRNHLMRLDLKEWRRVWGSALGAARRFFSSATSRPLDLDVWNELDRFYDSLPAGVFAVDGYERFLEDFMARRGIPRRFDELPKPLLVVATDLDAGDRAVFGDGALLRVPVARAVAASSASPLLFAPVRIDDRDYVDCGLGDVGHLDLVTERGCDTVLVINPLVPVRPDSSLREVPTGHGRKRRLRDKGLLWVYSQSFRISSETRFLSGLSRFRVEHPEAQVALVEPAPHDTTMFMHSPMNFSARRAILQDGYTSTLGLLRQEDSALCQVLESTGLRPRPRS